MMIFFCRKMIVSYMYVFLIW